MDYFRLKVLYGRSSKFMYEDADSNTYFSRPWMANVLIERDDNTYQCGAAIINQQ